ncbi:lactoylglutathione lyase-like [Oratosquilla oratoria]|uniref:lactoylglutathione lyase-like n=1 Tax=Oratosquilla oratoria TaxID=337810 RepID=UPI003F7747A1
MSTTGRPVPDGAVAAACAEPDPATKGFVFQQAMIRVQNPEVSLDFYTRVMGMRLLKKVDVEPLKFSSYFMGYAEADEVPTDEKKRTWWCFARNIALELTYNWRAETEPEPPRDHNKCTHPRGFGHLGFTVPDVDAACQRFEALGVSFVKKPRGGTLMDIALIQDPDGFWIEILNPEKMASNF